MCFTFAEKMITDLDVDGRGVRIAPLHKLWRFTKLVLQARRIDDRVIVIFDYMAYPNGQPAKNLVAYDLDQNELWTAENPTNMPTDAFVNFCPGDSLRVANFAGCICTVDPTDGSVIDTIFTK